jgi:hypothetical protein
MRKSLRLAVAGFLLTTGATTASLVTTHARADEVTTAQDQARTGWDPNEPGLSPATLTSGGFGKLFATQLTGQIYAQPLVIGSQVVVTTEENNVYGLNAQTGAINWQLSLGPSWPSSAMGCTDMTPSIGSTSTPVYDPSTGEVYLTAVVNDGSSLYQPHIYLVAVNAQTGQKDWQIPVQGAPANDPSRPFDPLTERQRASLLLMNGTVYMGFGSYCDIAPYTGYVAGVTVSPTTGSTHKLTMWTDEAGLTDDQSGIWMTGSGLMSDGSGRIFVTTGNGVSPPPSTGTGTTSPSELGDSVVRLGVQSDGTLAAQDFFSPVNAPTLDTEDQDFGSGGPVALPFGTTTYPHLLVQAGKDGRIFLLDSDSLGGRGTTTDRPVSMSGPYRAQFGRPAAFAGAGGADYLYYSGVGDYLRALKFTVPPTTGTDPAKPVFTDVANSATPFSYTSGSPVVTSNSADPASAVVWEVDSAGASSTLDAFAAVPAAGAAHLTQLWSAPIGTGAKFSTPATDSGRVYVGTNDGKVYGFGSPDAAPLTGTSQPATTPVDTPVTFPVTLTAKTAVTVTGVSTTSPAATNPFKASLPNGGTPSLSAGQTLTVDVTFTPATAGGVTGSLQVATDTPNFAAVSIPLAADATETGLFATPSSLAFGTVPAGNSVTLPATILNGGTSAETITGTTGPSAPFTITGMPATLAAGASATVEVTYKPTAAQADSGSVTITGSAGPAATVSLSGTGVTGQGTLSAAPASVSFGTVPLGQRSEQVIQVTNTGNLPMTITGFSAPGAPFGTPDPVTTGITLDPGYDLTIPVTFTPQSETAASASYALIASDKRNAPQTLTVTVSGTGAAPASGVAVPEPGGGWTLNGSAQMTGGTNLTSSVLRLTTAAKGQAGSAVYYQPVASGGLHARFTAHLGGGTGADGMTFAMLDASSASPRALGGAGGGLGFAGLPGVAVVLDTFPGNFAGIATGTSASGLVFAAKSTAVPNLRAGSHVVDVSVSGGKIMVAVDGTQYLSAAVTVPAQVLPAFTGATGGLTDVHDVSAVSLSAAGTGSSAATALPQPGGGWSYNGSAVMAGSDTLLTKAVAGQDGSVVYPVPVLTSGLHAEFTMRIGGGTGADGMTFALLNPASAATARGSGGSELGFGGLSGVAVAFDTSQVTGYPSSNFAGIATGVVKAGELRFSKTVTGIGQLRAGTHDVVVSVTGNVLVVDLDGAQILQQQVALSPSAVLAFTGSDGLGSDQHAISDVAISAGSFAQPPPGAPGWTVTGSAAEVAGSLVLTPAAKAQHGSAFYDSAVPSAGLTATFAATIGGGTGADGMTFAMLDASKAGPGSIGTDGGGLGFAGLPGVAVTLDTYPGNSVGIASSTAGGAMSLLASTIHVPALRATTTVRVTVSASGVITVWINGTQVLSHAAPVPASVLTGFTAGTGSLDDRHAVSNVLVTP